MLKINKLNVTVDDKNGRKREKVKNFCELYKGG